jgi:uroporphyrinogen-III synthase
MDGTEISYFCSDIRMDDLPAVLNENNINVQEVEAYSTKLGAPKLKDSIEGVMFYSPSTIKSFLQKK